VLPGWAVSLPEHLADALRAGDPPVLARVNDGRALVDPRALVPSQDAEVTDAVVAAARAPRH
jgi:L-seryl-tRNA(Ser) seleniumtransferase